MWPKDAMSLVSACASVSLCATNTFGANIANHSSVNGESQISMWTLIIPCQIQEKEWAKLILYSRWILPIQSNRTITNDKSRGDMTPRPRTVRSLLRDFRGYVRFPQDYKGLSVEFQIITLVLAIVPQIFR